MNVYSRSRYQPNKDQAQDRGKMTSSSRLSREKATSPRKYKSATKQKCRGEFHRRRTFMCKCWL